MRSSASAPVSQHRAARPQTSHWPVRKRELPGKRTPMCNRIIKNETEMEIKLAPCRRPKVKHLFEYCLGGNFLAGVDELK
jgi:hypothetical protein